MAGEPPTQYCAKCRDPISMCCCPEIAIEAGVSISRNKRAGQSVSDGGRLEEQIKIKNAVLLRFIAWKESPSDSHVEDLIQLSRDAELALAGKPPSVIDGNGDQCRAPVTPAQAPVRQEEGEWWVIDHTSGTSTLYCGHKHNALQVVKELAPVMKWIARMHNESRLASTASLRDKTEQQKASGEPEPLFESVEASRQIALTLQTFPDTEGYWLLIRNRKPHLYAKLVWVRRFGEDWRQHEKGGKWWNCQEGTWFQLPLDQLSHIVLSSHGGSSSAPRVSSLNSTAEQTLGEPDASSANARKGQMELLQRATEAEHLNLGLVDENLRLRKALKRLRDCDWVITPHDRMDAVRQIAREALGGSTVSVATPRSDGSGSPSAKDSCSPGSGLPKAEEGF